MRAMLVLGLGAALLTPRAADACGGCFHEPPPTETGMVGGSNDVQVVTDHRMVLSLSSTQTTLWDQIRYAGDPDSFIWVLPIADPATVDVAVADNAFIDAVDRLGAPVIRSPVATCYSDGTGTASARYSAGGCGGSTLDYVSTTGDASQSATLHGEEDSTAGPMGGAVVGPYAAEIVGGGPGQPTFEQWLTDNHFMIPDAVRPALQYYQSLNFSFVVLHLRPGVGVQQMQPVRVTTHAYAPTLPLRMVAAGAGEKVGLMLSVFASTSVVARNFANATVPDAALSYDFATQRSNYREAFDAALATSVGRTWVIESVQQVLEGLMDVGGDAGVDAGFDAANADDAGLGDDAGDDAGPVTMTPTDPLEDRRVAFTGLHGVAKLTRMRTRLSPTDLDADLTLEPGATGQFGPVRDAARGTNLPCSDAGTGARDAGTPVRDAGSPDAGGSSAAYSCRSSRRAGPGGWLVAAAVASLAVRRSRRRR